MLKNINLKSPEDVEYFNDLVSIITNDARCTRDIKSGIATAKAAFNKKKNHFTSKLDLNLRKELVKCYILITALYGAKTYTCRQIDRKHLEIFEMCYWTGIEKTSLTDDVRNDEVRQKVTEERNILQTIKRRRVTGLIKSCVGTAF